MRGELIEVSIVIELGGGFGYYAPTYPKKGEWLDVNTVNYKGRFYVKDVVHRVREDRGNIESYVEVKVQRY